MTRVPLNPAGEPSSERQPPGQLWDALKSGRPTVSARYRALHFEVMLLGYQGSPPARCLKRMSNVWTHLQMKSILRSGGDDDLGVGWIEKRRSWAR